MATYSEDGSLKDMPTIADLATYTPAPFTPAQEQYLRAIIRAEVRRAQGQRKLTRG